MIDIPGNNEKPVAPYESFHAAFPRIYNNNEKDIYILSLWAILNHPLASLLIYQRSRIQWISTKKFRDFPLPAHWDIDAVTPLAEKAEKFIKSVRNIQRDYDNIYKMLNDIDDHIYHMYGITVKERQRIEKWFGDEPRPGLKELFPEKKLKKKKTPSQPVNKIYYSEHTFKTSCETLEISCQHRKIRLAIDGMDECNEDIDPSEHGVWLKIHPVMPGWLLQEGAVGWIELATGNIRKLAKHPERYILDFEMLKNAYQSQDEIDQELMVI